MRKNIFLLILLVISDLLLFSCKNHEERTSAEVFISLKNGEKVSYNEYQDLRRSVYEGISRSFLLRELNKKNPEITQKEILEVMDKETMVVLKNSPKVKQTTVPSGR